MTKLVSSPPHYLYNGAIPYPNIVHPTTSFQLGLASINTRLVRYTVGQQTHLVNGRLKMHIAIFNCLKPIQGRTCPDMFKNLVDRGLDYNKNRLSTSNGYISYEIHNCSAEEFPSCYAAIDAIIITGSPKSCYDRHSWIMKMHEVLRGMVWHCLDFLC